MSATASKLRRCILALIPAIALAGCGGVPKSISSSSTQSDAVSVKLNKTSVTLQTNGQEQFIATVSGTTNTAVHWTVDMVSGGNSNVGIISATGLYLAPEGAGTHTVTATTVVNAKKSASAMVTVQGTVSVTPASVGLMAGTTQQFTVSVQGQTNPSVTWSVDGVAGGNSTVGTINAQGIYTAPASVGNHAITANIASLKESANAAVSVFTLSVSPANSLLEPGATQQFAASIQGLSNTGVTWSVDGNAGGNSTVGTITASGLYTAPNATGAHTIGATSQEFTSGVATTGVSVFTISVSPGFALLDPEATQQFTASIEGLSDTGVTWSVDGNAGGNSAVGTISTNGLYTAPNATGAHTIAATSQADNLAVTTTQVTIANVSQSAVLTYHNDDQRDGAYTQEVTLTPSNVNSNQFGKLLSYPVDGQIYAQPLYVPQLSINGGTRDVVFVETQNNSVYAFDADATASSPTTLWHVNLGPSIQVYDSGGPWPNVGILSTPVIDTTTNTMYLVAHVSNTSSWYQLHALDIITGKDKVLPVSIAASYSGDNLGNGCYQRMGLALDPVTNWIYIAIGSCPNGWIMAYDKSSLMQKAVFESTNGAQGGGFWASGGAPAIDDATGNVYLMSGTDYDDQWISPPPAYTQTGYNDSFLYLNPTTLAVESYYSPDNNYVLAENDADLGSGSNVLVPGNSQYPLETIGGGKDGNVFVINPLDMGGFNSTNNVLQSIHTGVKQYDNIFSTPVYWNGSVYFHCNGDVLRAFSWNVDAAAGQQLSSSPTSMSSTVFGMHGATASLSSNGNNNAIIWEIDNSSYNSTNPVASGSAILHAYDATNVANELYNSAQAGSRDQAGQALKFTVPTIANGRVFVPTANELDIYGLLPQ
jgi:hypothetical protein